MKAISTGYWLWKKEKRTSRITKGSSGTRSPSLAMKAKIFKEKRRLKADEILTCQAN